jgi:hypothetical protein
MYVGVILAVYGFDVRLDYSVTMLTSDFFWKEFGVLFFVALVGAVAIVPYSARLLEHAAQKKNRSNCRALSFFCCRCFRVR